ncbi:MAG: hypothetical protein U0793_33475 [Gemmataceae bacterium]
MAITWTRILALLIALGYAIAALLLAPSPAMALSVVAGALAPLALIFLPEILGGSGIDRKKTTLGTYDEPGQRLNHPMRDSHPSIVAFMGWFFLIGLPPLVLWLVNR